MTKKSRSELTEQLFGVVHRVNLENAERCEPVYTLAEMLALKKITALRKIGRLYRVTGFSRMDKQKIIPALIKRMTDRKTLTDLLFILERHEWEMYKTIVKKKQLTDDKINSVNLLFLIHLGIIGMYYHAGHFHYVIPVEIQESYKGIEESGFAAEKEHGDLLNDYAIAAANLYGVITQEDFVKLFNSQNERKIDIDEMFGVLIKYAAMGYGYCFWEEYIVNDDFEKNDYKDVEYITRARVSKPRYTPSKQEILKFLDWEYIERTPELEKLRAYVEQILSGDTEKTEEIIEEIYFLCKFEAKTQKFVDKFEKRGVLFEFEQLKVLLSLIFDLQNNTRLWVNNGHTPNELVKLEHKHLRPLPREPIKVVKVGRNEPCPCGSGKKYKRCCGQ